MRPSWKVAGWRIEQLGRGVLPDVAGHDKRAVDARALGVNHPLRDTLPVEVCYLFDELVVLNQNRSSEEFWSSSTGRPAAVASVSLFFKCRSPVCYVYLPEVMSGHEEQ